MADRIRKDGTAVEAERPGGEFVLGARPVARVGYGAMQLAFHHDGAPRPGAIQVLRRVVELGVNHVDTAEFYGPSVVNRLIHDALHPYPDDLVLVSKVGAVWAEHGIAPAQHPAQLRAAVEANLRTLGLDRIDVVNLRRLGDTGPSVPVSDADRADFDDQLAEMIALRDEGKIGGIGLSSVSLEQLERALPAGIVCVQNAYNVLQRDDEPLLEVCAREHIAWVPYFPLGSASFPGQRQVTEHPAVIAAARRLGATPGQVGLAWLLAHDPDTLLIPGTSSIPHLEENAAAGSLRLDAETMATLDALAARAS